VTIKIKAPRAWSHDPKLGAWNADLKTDLCKPVRIVRESDWRKLMKLVRACEVDYLLMAPASVEFQKAMCALDAL
jgi:hypothetical protein